MTLRRSFHVLLSGIAIVFMAVVVPGTTGCRGFFTPACTTNCGGGTYSSYAYVANASIGTIEGFPIPTAAFTSLTGATTTLGATPSAIAATPKGTFLYVATFQGSVVVYSIGTNGALTLGNSGAPVASTLITPVSMAVDSSGSWLFVVCNQSAQLLIFQINSSTGALTQSAQGTVALSTGSPTQVYFTPNNQYVYIGLGTGGTDGFVFNSSTGAVSGQVHLAPRPGSGAADNAIAADNNSAYLFVGETVSGLRVLTIGTGGALTEVTGSPFATQLGPKSIVVDPTNTYVYVANSNANVISGYTLETGGTLTPLSSSPFNTGSAPYAMSLDSTGKYLFVISNGGSPDLQVFSFDTTTGGKLDSVVSTATGTDPAGAVSLSVVP